MTKDNVIDLKKPETFTDDPLTEILRNLIGDVGNLCNLY